MSFFTLSYILLWVLIAFESLVLVLVLRELGVLYLGRREVFERDGPDEGKPLPDLRAVGRDAGRGSHEDLRERQCVCDRGKRFTSLVAWRGRDVQELWRPR